MRIKRAIFLKYLEMCSSFFLKLLQPMFAEWLLWHLQPTSLAILSRHLSRLAALAFQSHEELHIL